MSDLVYPASKLVPALLTQFSKLSTLLREFLKLSALLRQIHPDAASWLKSTRQTQLPDKKLLQAKLHEFYLANVCKGEAE